MVRLQHQLTPEIVLDARRALWFCRARTLVVADLHLGYSWAQRHAGQMLPLGRDDEMVERLLELQRAYDPGDIVLLGDVVHRAVAVPALESQLKSLIASLAPASRLVFVLGNHDRQLNRLLNGCQWPVQMVSELSVGTHLLVHGDDGGHSPPLRQTIRAQGGRIVMGHEHPAIRLSDGITSAKCPCFLIGDDLIVLPAFSPWAAGTVAGEHSFLSRLARETVFKHAIAVAGERLLSLPISGSRNIS